ncbi:MAG: alpha/beta hydrolase [Fervidobacterium sp.]|uniref:alpha/beta hydrolase n=1 Tax=Fervidobacterium sp. TaxID=1871331 RepID=UPI00309C0CD9
MPSFETSIIQFFLRSFRFKYIIEKRIADGSLKREPAKPTKKLLRKFNIEEFTLLGRYVWAVAPKISEPQFAILFLHGGAYVGNVTKQHWDLVGELVDKLNALVVVPDYPLAPENTWRETYEFVDRLYEVMLEKYSDKKFVFIGDSAGGGLALGFAQKLRDESRKLPEHIVLFSPWIDVSMENPEIGNVESKDVILTVKGLKAAVEKYAAELDLKDWQISPIYGDFRGLCPVAIFTGTDDVLNPDARRLRDKLREQGVVCNYFEYNGLFHDWVILTFLKESREALEKLKNILRGL